MKKKLLVAGLCGVVFLLLGAVAVEKVFIESRIISSWGELVENYYSAREEVPPLPLPVGANDVAENMEKGDWSFLAENWQFNASGGTYYVADDSKLVKTLKFPLHIIVYEDLQRGEVVVLSSTDGEKYKGEAMFDAPEFLPLDLAPTLSSEEKAEEERIYLFWELSPRRIVWYVTLKPEEDAWADLVFQRESAVESMSPLEEGGMMAMMSVPPEHTNDIWISGESASNGFDVAVYCPSGVSNIEIYVSDDLVSNVWNVAAENLSLASGTNTISWFTSAENDTGFFRAGNEGLDSDSDDLCDARELYVCKTDVNDSDSDDDDLTDGEEVLTHGLDPNDPDTDDDQMPDGWELQYSLNPLLYADGELDADSDEISNLTEYQRETNPTNANDVTRKTDSWEPFVVSAYDLARSSNILFVSGNDTLLTFDVSVPTEPHFLGKTDVSSLGNSQLAVNGDIVYGFESRGEGLLVFDCTDPSVPYLETTISVPTDKVGSAEFRGVSVKEDALYVWDNSGVEIYSLTNSLSPQWISSIPNLSSADTNFYVCGVYVDNDFLYTGYYNYDDNGYYGFYYGKGFRVWNISDPLTPSLESFIPSTNLTYEFIRYSNTLYVADYNDDQSVARIVALDASSGFPTNYVPLATVESDVVSGVCLPRHFTADASWLYGYDWENNSLSTFDISNPLVLEETNSMTLTEFPNDAELYGSTLYLALGRRGIMILDISNPPIPEMGSSIGPNVSVIDITADGDRVCAGNSSGGVNILSVSNQALQSSGEFSAKYCSELLLFEEKAYVAMDSHGVSIWTTTSSPPQQVAELNTALSLDSISVRSNFVYCGSRSGKALLTLDCSDIENPVEVFTNDSLGYVDRLTVSEDRLYVSSFDEGLMIFSLTNAMQPELVGQLNTRSCFRDAVVGESNLVYAADGINGLLVLDASDPANLEKVGLLELKYAKRIALSGNRLCVIGYKSVCFISITDLQQPVLQQEFELEEETVAVCATADFFHVLDADNQLHTYFIP